MIFPPATKQKSNNRRSRGAIYSVCFIGFVTPCVLALGNTILQAALSFYNQERLDYVALDVIEHFQSLTDLDESSFEYLFRDMAAANGIQIQNARAQIQPCTDGGEQAVEIDIRGRFKNDLGLFTENRSFIKTYKIKLSKFETLGYLAINGYPYCELEPTRGLSAYLPIYRPSPHTPTWAFVQDNAIGNVRKSLSDINGYDDHKQSNWKNVADGLLSIY